MTAHRLNPADSGWITHPLVSGWVAYNSDQTPKYRKVGNVVQIVGAVKPTSTTTVGSTFVTVGRLPSGYTPSYRILGINPASGSNRVAVSVETGGSVAAGRYGTGTGYVDVTTTSWLPICINFMV